VQRFVFARAVAMQIVDQRPDRRLADDVQVDVDRDLREAAPDLRSSERSRATSEGESFSNAGNSSSSSAVQ